MPEVSAIISLPRLAPAMQLELPAKLVEHRGGLSTLRYVCSAIALLFRERPNLILCGHLNLLPLAAPLKVMSNVPLAIELYGIEAWTPRTSKYYAWCISKLDLAISISRFTRRKFVHWSGVTPAKVRVVPNAVHLDRYLLAGKPELLLDRYGLHGKKVLLTLGSLIASDRYKGQDRIIRLMRSLKKERPDLVYVIAGDGDDRSRLEELAQACGVRNDVLFVGRVKPDEILDHYNLADAFVMPSTGEGFGFVFLEAAACGLPVMGGSVDGSPDALGDGRIGLMVDPDDGDSLQSSLLRLLEMPKSVPSDLSRYEFKHFERQVTKLVAALSSPENRRNVEKKRSWKPMRARLL
jgi:glycosyltransferase involved in cell wall biosynthesis